MWTHSGSCLILWFSCMWYWNHVKLWNSDHEFIALKSSLLCLAVNPLMASDGFVDNLQVSYDIFRDSLSDYQKMVKRARANYFCIIAEKSFQSQFYLVHWILLLVLLSLTFLMSLYKLVKILNIYWEDCWCSIFYLVTRLWSIRSIYMLCCLSSVWVSFTTLAEIVEHMKPTASPQNIIPTHTFKQVFHIIRPSILAIMNCCLVTGCVPVFFKHAIVQPLIKKSHLDPKVLEKLFLPDYRPWSFFSQVLEHNKVQNQHF